MNESLSTRLSLSNNDYWVWDHSFHSILDNLPTTQLQTTPHRHTDYQPTNLHSFIHLVFLFLTTITFLRATFLSSQMWDSWIKWWFDGQPLLFRFHITCPSLFFILFLSSFFFPSSLLLSEALVATYQFKGKKKERKRDDFYLLSILFSLSLSDPRSLHSFFFSSTKTRKWIEREWLKQPHTQSRIWYFLFFFFGNFFRREREYEREREMKVAWNYKAYELNEWLLQEWRSSSPHFLLSLSLSTCSNASNSIREKCTNQKRKENDFRDREKAKN